MLMADKLVGGRYRPPAREDREVVRCRVSEMLRRSLRHCDITAVIATAGAGKSTAVAHALDGWPSPTCWMRIEDGDQTPGRLLLYLERALLTAVPPMTPWSAMRSPRRSPTRRWPPCSPRR